MSDVAIRVENLGKRYHIGAAQANYKTLRDSLVEGVNSLRSAAKREPKPILWALKDVSFEVKQGEVIGVIGRNGAGKSTLLKVLAHITRPTTGRVEIHGRVGSLLEVGTGFHPELTGRDNIYLNGAILGMKRAEIDRKFDEIVAFAEIEKFLDTPAKHYSSGMYMRLAFAVAAHLEPEILLVDEVLAVGDAEFQKKCLGKMGEVAGEGRTVLFVSHHLGMIKTICYSGILLYDGKIISNGIISDVIDVYESTFLNHIDKQNTVTFPVKTNNKCQFLRANIKPANGQVKSEYDVFENLLVFIEYELFEDLQGTAVILTLKRNSEILFITFDTDINSELLSNRKKGKYSAIVELPSPLKNGNYSIDLSIGVLNKGGLDTHNDILGFNISEMSFNPSAKSYSSYRPGVIVKEIKWNYIA